MDLSDKQQYELLAAISARGEIPTKFAYLDGGEKLWDAVYNQRSQSNGMANAELNLLMSHIAGFTHVFLGAEGINLVDLGCGNGTPAVAIIKELKDCGFKVNYVAVDISSDMIELATNAIQVAFPEISIHKLHLDFEKESLADELLGIQQQNHYPNLLIDLGNTLGNHVNVNSVLTNFLESMTLNDYLIIGNGLANDYNPQRILEAYNDVVKELTVHLARILGIYDDTDEFEYIWNARKTRVEGRVRLKNDKTITLAHQNIDLRQGEEIMVLQSNKYSESSLTKLLSDVGFRTELLTTTKDRSHILTMVQPTRYTAS